MEKIKSILESKNTIYCGYFVPIIVNSVACFLCRGNSNIPLGATNLMLMFFFTGCYYIFCLFYFRSKLREIWLYCLGIIVPLAIYKLLIQPFIEVENWRTDMTLTSLYYMTFYILFFIKYHHTNKLLTIVGRLILGLLIAISATIIEITIIDWFTIPTKGIEGAFFHPQGTILQHADYIVFSIYMTIIIALFNSAYFSIMAFVHKKNRLAIISYITYTMVVLIYCIYVIIKSNAIITVTNQV